MELIQYDESPTINIYFDPVKTATTPDNLGIPSLHFDQINQVSQILFKVGQGEDIPNYCEPTPETILQEMERVCISPGVPETGNNNRDK